MTTAQPCGSSRRPFCRRPLSPTRKNLPIPPPPEIGTSCGASGLLELSRDVSFATPAGRTIFSPSFPRRSVGWVRRSRRHRVTLGRRDSLHPRRSRPVLLRSVPSVQARKLIIPVRVPIELRGSSYSNRAMASRRVDRRIGADPASELERTLLGRRRAEGKLRDSPAQTAVTVASQCLMCPLVGRYGRQISANAD